MSYKMHILVCGGTGCRASASHRIITRLEECLKERNLEDEVQVIATGCFGFCEKGPIVKVMPDNTFYVGETGRRRGNCKRTCYQRT